MQRADHLLQYGVYISGWFASLLLVTACASTPAKTNLGISASDCRAHYQIQTDFRTDHYRAPTPACTPYGTTLTTQQLVSLQSQDSNLIFVDVLGVTRRPEMDEFDSAWLPSKTRLNIAGSHWLPNVGYAQLDEEMQQYLSEQLNRITQQNKTRPMVIYCIVDCWLSWNTIKRAYHLGYQNLYWYPDGTDGWEEQGLPLFESTPIPIYPDENL